MKLLSVVASYWPAYQFGGPIFSLHNLNKKLVTKGMDVTVYTTNVGLNDRVPTNKEITLDGVKVTYFSYTKFFDFLGTTGWTFSLPMTKALRNTVMNFDIIYIVAIWNYPIAVAAHFCRKYKKPYVISPRGMLYPYTLHKKLWKKYPYYYFVAKRDIKKASAIHYTTKDEANKCHPYLGLHNPALVIPNGLDLSNYSPSQIRANFKDRHTYLKDKYVILFLGRINGKKGLCILIEAYNMLLIERDDIHLLIAGNDEGGYKNNIKKLININGMEYVDIEEQNKNSPFDKRKYQQTGHKEPNVTFTGFLNEKEKLEAFASSDIFVLPSYSENFGNAVIEAMICGIPTVISNNVGIHEEVEQNRSGIVVVSNAKSVYRGIKELLSNLNLRKEIAENGKRLVKNNYDIERVADKMIECLESVLNTSNLQKLL
jgi:glycosyltransferase involved in cell wall biosynthesis